MLYCRIITIMKVEKKFIAGKFIGKEFNLDPFQSLKKEKFNLQNTWNMESLVKLTKIKCCIWNGKEFSIGFRHVSRFFK